MTLVLLSGEATDADAGLIHSRSLTVRVQFSGHGRQALLSSCPA